MASMVKTSDGEKIRERQLPQQHLTTAAQTARDAGEKSRSDRQPVEDEDPSVVRIPRGSIFCLVRCDVMSTCYAIDSCTYVVSKGEASSPRLGWTPQEGGGAPLVHQGNTALPQRANVGGGTDCVGVAGAPFILRRRLLPRCRRRGPLHCLLIAYLEPSRPLTIFCPTVLGYPEGPSQLTCPVLRKGSRPCGDLPCLFFDRLWHQTWRLGRRIFHCETVFQMVLRRCPSHMIRFRGWNKPIQRPSSARALFTCRYAASAGRCGLEKRFQVSMSEVTSLAPLYEDLPQELPTTCPQSRSRIPPPLYQHLCRLAHQRATRP